VRGAAEQPTGTSGGGAVERGRVRGIGEPGEVADVGGRRSDALRQTTAEPLRAGPAVGFGRAPRFAPGPVEADAAKARRARSSSRRRTSGGEGERGAEAAEEEEGGVGASSTSRSRSRGRHRRRSRSRSRRRRTAGDPAATSGRSASRGGGATTADDGAEQVRMGRGGVLLPHEGKHALYAGARAARAEHPVLRFHIPSVPRPGRPLPTELCRLCAWQSSPNHLTPLPPHMQQLTASPSHTSESESEEEEEPLAPLRHLDAAYAAVLPRVPGANFAASSSRRFDWLPGPAAAGDATAGRAVVTQRRQRRRRRRWAVSEAGGGGSGADAGAPAAGGVMSAGEQAAGGAVPAAERGAQSGGAAGIGGGDTTAAHAAAAAAAAAGEVPGAPATPDSDSDEDSVDMDEYREPMAPLEGLAAAVDAVRPRVRATTFAHRSVAEQMRQELQVAEGCARRVCRQKRGGESRTGIMCDTVVSLCC
jgi:hypothetical protein